MSTVSFQVNRQSSYLLTGYSRLMAIAIMPMSMHIISRSSCPLKTPAIKLLYTKQTVNSLLRLNFRALEALEVSVEGKMIILHSIHSPHFYFQQQYSNMMLKIRGWDGNPTSAWKLTPPQCRRPAK